MYKFHCSPYFTNYVGLVCQTLRFYKNNVYVFLVTAPVSTNSVFSVTTVVIDFVHIVICDCGIANFNE